MDLTGVVAVDIGNSRIKLQIGVDVVNLDYNNSWRSKLREQISLIRDQLFNKQIRIYFSSVKSEGAIALQDACDVASVPCIDIAPIFDEVNKIDHSAVSGIGIDRLLSLMGALSYHKGPLATVDCGTAVTVNFLKGNNKAAGGYIFPGAYTQLAALAEKSESLKNIDLTFDKIVPGKSTPDAVSAGILSSIVGGIKEALAHYIYSEKISDPFHVFFTGGYGAEVITLLDMDGIAALYYRNLVLKGIYRTLELYFSKGKEA